MNKRALMLAAGTYILGIQGSQEFTLTNNSPLALKVVLAACVRGRTEWTKVVVSEAQIKDIKQDESVDLIKYVPLLKRGEHAVLIKYIEGEIPYVVDPLMGNLTYLTEHSNSRYLQITNNTTDGCWNRFYSPGVRSELKTIATGHTYNAPLTEFMSLPMTPERIQAYKDTSHAFGIAVTDDTINQWLTAQEDAALTLKQKGVFAILSHTVEPLINLAPYTSP